MIRVWTNGQRAGVLDRLANAGTRTGTSFAYPPETSAERAVSMTMPHRVQSYDWARGLLPIFEMNVPEGALRERLRRTFAKATGAFDDFDLLSIVGRTQLGRIRYSGLDDALDETVPFQSVDEILRARRDGGLFDHLLERFAQYSGLSGVQPKVLIRDEAKFSAGKTRRSSSIRAATHIVKLWDANEFPELAANEYCCLLAARKAGLEVPHFTLSDTGEALVVERFDIRGDDYLGLEDFCVLNGLGAEHKYEGSYETRLFKRARDFIEPADQPQAMQSLYRLFVLNTALRNGDAHLKNFALTYSHVNGPARLAPIYDLVTTQAYLPRDMMALTLEGSTRWPDAKRLARLGQLRAELSLSAIAHIFEATADAMRDAWAEAAGHFRDSTEPGVAERMKAAWDAGIGESLGLSRPMIRVRMPVRSTDENFDATSPSKGKAVLDQKDQNTGRSPKLARSQVAVLAHLRAQGGSYSGPAAAMAATLALPASTLRGALRGLHERGLIERTGRTITLK